MKVYRFLSWVVDKHIRRDCRVHEYTVMKDAKAAQKDCIKEGRFVSMIEAKWIY